MWRIKARSLWKFRGGCYFIAQKICEYCPRWMNPVMRFFVTIGMTAENAVEGMASQHGALDVLREIRR